MAKNIKGGYKIVSLNGLDLTGESLAIVGLYEKLAHSYDKPILVTNIVIDGEKKKNAFVQVEVVDDGIKINDLYGYDLLIEEDGDITVSANPQELPSTAEASAGQILGLDINKKPEWQNKPASGTKLYKHELTGTIDIVFQRTDFSVDASTGNFSSEAGINGSASITKIIVYSLSNTPITEATFNSDIAFSIITAYGYKASNSYENTPYQLNIEGAEGGSKFTFGVVNANHEMKVVNNKLTMKKFYVSSSGTLTDTVTEL